ncbi:Hypothetical predicted protein [Paramuricea clavata]|uniref:Uncharacterized protein n=1 Tax=Paramuricea clavata TaxID=317549 RepID=A0A7D9KEI1_PARCT|nr:Hypothetical predicted protein [Paramuricea clavata]
MFALVGGFMYIGYLYGKTDSGNRNKYTPKQFPYNDNHHIYKNGDPTQRLKIN